MSNHQNPFSAKTEEELKDLYREFLKTEQKGVFNSGTELWKIHTQYEKDFGATATLMLQIELTHTIADLWFSKGN